MALNTPRYTRGFVQKQTIFSAVNNSSGTWTATNANLLRFPENGIQLDPVMPKTPIDWLTGTRSAQPGILGRRSARVQLNNFPMYPSGTAGTAPDSGPIWEHAFGTQTVSAGTSVAYTLSDAIPSALTFLKFQHGFSGMTQQLVWGTCVQDITWTLNGNIFEASLNGQGAYLLDSDNFANEETAALAALTVYPAEPGSPTSTGTIIPGVSGTASFVSGASTDAIECKIQACVIKYNTGLAINNTVFCSPYGQFIEAGTRQVTLSMSLVDDDSAAAKDLKVQAKQAGGAGTPGLITATIVVGTVAGLKVQFVVSGLQLVPQSMVDSGNIVLAQYPDSAAHATSVSGINELAMTFL